MCIRDSIEPVIIVTKDELAPADELVSIYKHAGFVSVAVSNETGEGVGEVREKLFTHLSSRRK